jgi:hypothetical protein
MQPCTARSKSADSKTINAALPPSSSPMRLMVLAPCLYRIFPTYNGYRYGQRYGNSKKKRLQYLEVILGIRIRWNLDLFYRFRIRRIDRIRSRCGPNPTYGMWNKKKLQKKYFSFRSKFFTTGTRYRYNNFSG